MDTERLVQDFTQVAALAGKILEASAIHVETLKAPHRPPSRLPTGKMAVYVFCHKDMVLKVGKVGSKSAARYISQHYNAASAASTLAASLIKNGGEIGVSGLTVESAGNWIKANTDRINFLMGTEQGIAVLTLLEAFLQCRLKPKFEGFSSQQ